jgi:hypothetical protein
MQAHRFSCGGYVAHKLRVHALSTMRYSAWFTDDGKLIDAEGIDRLFRARPASAAIKAALAKQFPLVRETAGGPA